MAEVIPFRGIRYNLDKIKEAKLVVAPPYDVISAGDQEHYYQDHPYNIIRLILGKEYQEDNMINNRYTRAAEYFKSWQENKILVRDPKPSFYIYRQEFKLRGGIEKKRTGFIGLAKLEETGSKGIRLHEKTLVEPKCDRLNLIRACDTNFSPIFSLYADDRHLIKEILADVTEKRKPLVSFADEQGITDTLWQLTDSKAIQKMILEMRDKELFIADGHHRYEVALAYAKQRQKNNSGSHNSKLYNYVMMMFIDMDDPGVVILPTHRLIKKIPGQNLYGLEASLNHFFTVETLEGDRGSKENKLESFMERIKIYNSQGENAFGLYRGNNQFEILRLKDQKETEGLIEGSSQEYKKLDVTILHSVLIGHILKVKDKRYIEYVTDERKAVNAVDKGRSQVALFLAPIQIAQVKRIARAHETMPQKSTFFYPKLVTGLAINKLH